MKRLEKFRAIRIARKKCIFISSTCFIMIFMGIFTVDYSLNGLMNNEKGLNLFSVKRIEGDYYNIEIFNKGLHFNPKYIKEEFNKFVQWVNSSLKSDN